MPNTLTDSLNFVQQEEETRDSFPLFKRARTDKYGFALVVIRKGSLVGYIPSKGITVESDIQRNYTRMGVKKGDVILNVNLGPQSLQIKDTLPTQDRYPRFYSLELEISVTDPLQFTQRYIEQVDPVAKAKTAIEGFIQDSASGYTHDELTVERLREWAKDALTIEPHKDYGLSVRVVHKVTFPENPDRIRELKLEREKELKILEAKQKGEIERARTQQDIYTGQLKALGDVETRQLTSSGERKIQEEEAQYKRDEQVRQDEHERERQHQDLTHQLNIQGIQQQLKEGEVQGEISIEKIKALHDREVWEERIRRESIEQLAKKLIPVLGSRINESLINDRKLLSEAANDPELRDFLRIFGGGTLPPLLTERSNVRVSPSPEGDDTSAGQASSVQSQSTQALPGVLQQKADVIEVPDLGLRLIQTTLSEEQRQIAATETYTGFLISTVNEHGPAKKADLRVGDIVIELNHVELTTVQDISQAIDVQKSEDALPVCVLRNERLHECKIDMHP